MPEGRYGAPAVAMPEGPPCGVPSPGSLAQPTALALSRPPLPPEPSRSLPGAFPEPSKTPPRRGDVPPLRARRAGRRLRRAHLLRGAERHPGVPGPPPRPLWTPLSRVCSLRSPRSACLCALFTASVGEREVSPQTPSVATSPELCARGDVAAEPAECLVSLCVCVCVCVCVCRSQRAVISCLASTPIPYRAPVSQPAPLAAPPLIPDSLRRCARLGTRRVPYLQSTEPSVGSGPWVVR